MASPLHVLAEGVTTTLVVLALGWFALGLLIDVACPINVRWLRRRRAANAVEPGAAVPSRYLVVIPTVGEATLRATLDAVAAVEVPAALAMDVVVVGPPEYERGAMPGISRLPPPPHDRSKPAQLEHALRSRRAPGREEYDYVVMVDSDTIVPPDMLVQMTAAAAAPTPDDWPRALQPLVVSAPGGRSGATRADAALHTRWRLGYELSLLRIAHGRGHRRRRWAPYTYAVGCCLAVRWDRACEGFGRPAEDLSLGYELSAAGHAMAPVPTIAVTVTKGHVLGTARRNLTWWLAGRRALRDQHVSDRRSRILRALERVRLYAWVPGPLIFSAAVGAQWLQAEGAVDPRLALLLAAPVVTYVVAGVALLLSGPEMRPGWRQPSLRTATTTIAWGLLRWTWACALPFGGLLRRSSLVRASAASVAQQLQWLGAALAGSPLPPSVLAARDGLPPASPPLGRRPGRS